MVRFFGAAELCDGIDNNCNSTIDDGVVNVLVWPDLDGDGDGDPNATPLDTCDPPSDYVLNDDDCDDTDASIFAGAPETAGGGRFPTG